MLTLHSSQFLKYWCSFKQKGNSRILPITRDRMHMDETVLRVSEDRGPKVPGQLCERPCVRGLIARGEQIPLHVAHENSNSINILEAGNKVARNFDLDIAELCIGFGSVTAR